MNYDVHDVVYETHAVICTWHHHECLQQRVIRSFELLSVWQEQMETECESNDHDDKDNGDCKEGVDDVLKEDDVFPDSVQEPHVEEKVDPGKGEGDGTDLPVQARSLSPNEVVARHEESEGVDESVKEENSR